MYNSTLTRKTPLRAKAALKSKCSLRSYSSLKAIKGLGRKCHNTPKKVSQAPYKPKYKYQSIFTDELSKCFISGCNEGWYEGGYHSIHIHHIFGASNKANSEKYHFIIPLRDDWHNMSDYGVHFNKELDLALKRVCQAYWLMEYGTKEEFIAVFSKWW